MLFPEGPSGKKNACGLSAISFPSGQDWGQDPERRTNEQEEKLIGHRQGLHRAVD